VVTCVNFCREGSSKIHRLSLSITEPSKQVETRSVPFSFITVNFEVPHHFFTVMAQGKSSSKSSNKKPGSTKTNRGSSLKSRSSSKSKVAVKAKAPPPVQQKTRSQSGPVKKKRKVYTDKELGLPRLNMITPVGVDLPKGKKKGKVFVDDQVSVRLLCLITPVVIVINC